MKRLILLACACLSAAAQGPDLARDLINKGYLSIQNGDAPGAIAQSEDAVRHDPADPLAAKLGYLYPKPHGSWACFTPSAASTPRPPRPTGIQTQLSERQRLGVT